MIHQPDHQEIVCRQLLAQSISEEPLPSGFYHEYEEDNEDLIDLEVESNFVDKPPPTPISIPNTDPSEAALRDNLSDRTASPSRFQPDNQSISTVGTKIYDDIRKF